ncbi:T-cell antigen CD7, partial [Chlamydotis macqueenii]
FLLKTHVQPERVLHVSSQNASTISPAFANRLEYSKEEKRIVITLHNLQKNDSGIYVCAGVVKNATFLSANRNGTMMLVKEVEEDCRNSSWGIYALTTVAVLLFAALVCCAFRCVNIKKYFMKKAPTTIYEDMSYSSIRKTLSKD